MSHDNSASMSGAGIVRRGRTHTHRHTCTCTHTGTPVTIPTASLSPIIIINIIIINHLLCLDLHTDGCTAALHTPTGYAAGESDIPDVPETANVKDYGALGDGVTDDSDAFVRAIQRMPVPGALYIPPGR